MRNCIRISLFGTEFQSSAMAFLLISCLFCFPLIFLIPPMQVADEPFHFFRSYQVSEGGWVGEKRDDKVGGMLPISFSMLNDFVHLYYQPRELRTKNPLSLLKAQSPEKEPRVFTHFLNPSLYSPTNYLPQSLGVWVARILNGNLLTVIYSGRFSNWLFATLICFVAILKTPCHPWCFFVLSLIPSSVYYRASLSMDALSHSVCLLFVAYFLRLRLQGVPLSFLQKGCFLFLTVLVTLAKQAYGLFPLMVFLFPKSLFLGRKERIIYLGQVLGLCFVCNVYWLFKAKGLFVPIAPGVDASGQLKYTLDHPVQVFQMIAETIFEKGRGWFRLAVGQLAWGDLFLPRWLQTGYLNTLLLLSLVGNCQLPKRFVVDKGLILMLFIATVFLIPLLIYISGTPVGLNDVGGFQGRYFVPLLFLLVILLFNHKVGRFFPQQWIGILSSLIVFVGVLFVWKLTYYRFY